ncbi:MAG: hypothetical protein COA40_05245 [Aequorivita sp.]|nr:MAG: hypothetical protein COA40_05245 [Aequorivita sp.]
MKTLYILLTIIIFQTSVAQDPRLFENDWYLYEVMSTDLGTHYDVSSINPPIAPYLRISENLNFNGEGACNTFSGVYEYSPGYLGSIIFTYSTEDCNIQQHNSFENEYFGFISGGYTYTITENNQGKIFSLSSPLMGHAVFKSYPLSTSNFQKNKFQLYPNPVKNELFLTSLNNAGNLKLKIFNLESRLLSIQSLNFEKQTSIDVSHLSSGIYFLNIEDETGNTAIKMFIKA